MGIMPEGRERRWREIFRRYGLSTGTNAEPTPPADTLDELKKNAEKALLPVLNRRPDRKKKR